MQQKVENKYDFALPWLTQNLKQNKQTQHCRNRLSKGLLLPCCGDSYSRPIFIVSNCHQLEDVIMKTLSVLAKAEHLTVDDQL